MRGAWRAFVALALHIAFFLLPLGTVLGLAAIAVVTFLRSTGLGLRAGLAAVAVGALLGVGMRAILRTRMRPKGVPLGRSEHPRLRKMAGNAATAAGVDPPDEIRITCEPGVTIREETALLGLRARVRYLEIGLPVIAGLTVSELHAVVAREMARLGQGAPAVARRIATSVEHTVSELVGGPTKWLFAGYAKLYLAIATPVRHELDLEAGASAVRLTGKKVAVTSLYKSTAIEVGWTEYVEDYLAMATAIDHAPDVLPGFRSFLEHTRRKPELAERAKRTIADEISDDGPTTKECIEATKRVTDRERKRDDHPAVALLNDPRTTVPELEDELMVDGLGPRKPWPELAQLAGAAEAEHKAATLSLAVEQSGVGKDGSIGSVLAAMHQGESANLINPVLNPGLDPDRLDDAVVDTLTDLLGAAVVDALVSTRRAHHELDWGGSSVVRLAGGQPLDPDRLVRPAVADPRLIPGLHRALVDLGVPLTHSRPPAADPEPTLAGVVSAVRFGSRRYELLVTDRGLLLVRSESSTVRHLLSGVLARARQAEDERLSELSATPIDELREESDAQWVDSRDVASARFRTGRSEWTLEVELYLDECAVSSLDQAAVTWDEEDMARIRVSSTSDSVERGDPYGGLGELMGARMADDPGSPKESPERAKD